MTELTRLIEAYFASELTDEQSRELSIRLVGSAETRRAVWEYAQQEVLLEQLVEESCGDLRPFPVNPEASGSIQAERALSGSLCQKGPDPLRAGDFQGESIALPSVSPLLPQAAGASGLTRSRQQRWLSAAAIFVLMAAVGSAAVLPPVRGRFVRWWQGVVPGVHGNKAQDIAQDNVDPTAKTVSPRVEESKQATAPKNVELTEPLPKPKLNDVQKISAWEWDKFKWQTVDAELVRPVTFAVTVPPGHKFVTVAMDDARGVRVRNLLDAVEVSKLGGNPDATEPQKLAVEWNGMNDDGQPMPDGIYHVRGCSHPGLKLVYDYSFLNPGTPPWEHYPNSGWGGDHGFPHAIACLRGHSGGKWRVAIGGTIAEGGSPAFILGAEDRKVHSFGRGWAGPKAFAAAEGQIWVGLWTGKDLLRLEYHTGRQVPFKTAKGMQVALTFDADVWGIAVGATRVAVRLHDEKDPRKERVVLFDRETGENRVDVRFPTPIRRNGLAMLKDGKTVVVATDAGLFEFDTTDTQPMPHGLALEGVEKPGPLATDAEGNLYVLDRGHDYQVKVYSPERKLIRTIGTRGGQGDRLSYDPVALHGVEAISVDDDENLWAAENGDQDNPPGRGFVRRIAVWDRNGKLVKDFVGTTWYGANNTCLHEQDPTLAIGYGVIYKLEPGGLWAS